MNNRANHWQSLDKAIHQWWFLGLLMLPELLPPFASRGYVLSEWGAVNAFIITHPIKVDFSGFYLVFQIIPLTIVIAAFIFREKVSRLFGAYVCLSYGLIAFLQSISISQTWGVAVCTGNLVVFLFLSLLWIYEMIHPQNRIDIRKDTVWRYWPLLLAFAAFWEPINRQTLLPDFNPASLFISDAGLSFCMATPLYLAILILSYPQVNKTVFASTAFVGLFMGISNLVLEFVIYPAWIWIGILHFPLVILSLYSLSLVLMEGKKF